MLESLAAFVVQSISGPQSLVPKSLRFRRHREQNVTGRAWTTGRQLRPFRPGPPPGGGEMPLGRESDNGQSLRLSLFFGHSRPEDDRYHCSRACTPQKCCSDRQGRVKKCQHAVQQQWGTGRHPGFSVQLVGCMDVGCCKVQTGTAWSVRRLPSGRRPQLCRL